MREIGFAPQPPRNEAHLVSCKLRSVPLPVPAGASLAHEYLKGSGLVIKRNDAPWMLATDIGERFIKGVLIMNFLVGLCSAHLSTKWPNGGLKQLEISVTIKSLQR